MRRRELLKAAIGPFPASQVRAAASRFQFELLHEQPVFDISPHHARMCSCYRDRAGVYHLFTDFIPASAGTMASWQADIRYYRSRNLKDWKFMDTAVPRGRWRGSRQASDLDWYGAASPCAFASYGKVYLFYAGREHGRGPDAAREPLRCRILVAESVAGRDGAPIRRFRKQGVVLNKGKGDYWDGLRVDDPCVLRVGETVHLYYKGLPHGAGRDMHRIGHATALVGRRVFVRSPSYVYAVGGGGGMPRVFHRGGQWHMFLRHYREDGGAQWRHHIATDGRDWHLHDENLFDGAGPIAGRGATDVSLIRSIDGQLAEPVTALATGFAGGALKLWAYRVRER